MSNRTQADTSARAFLRASHIAQIDALTRPGLSDEDRIKLFGEAAEFTPEHVRFSLTTKFSPARECWRSGDCPLSLFADLPDALCCPVIAQVEGVPRRLEDDWRPTAEELEVFSKIQIERRFP